MLFSLGFLTQHTDLQAQTPLGPVTQTNVNTNDAGGFSSNTDIAINSSNRYAVVWNRRVNFGTNIQSVFVRIYNSNGTPATGEINVVGDKSINDPQVGMDNSGNVYVMYDDKVSSSGTNYYLKVKKYSSTGTLLATKTIEQIDQSCYADIAVMPNGRVIVFYTNTSNQLRLRVYNSSLGLQGTTTISSGTKYYQHHIDERDGKVAIAYSASGIFRVRKYQVNSSSFSFLNSANLSSGFSNDPIALREDGQVALLLSSGGSTVYQLRSSNLAFSNSITLPSSTFSINAAIDTDEDDNTYVLWNNNAGGTDGRIYNSSNSLTGSFNHGFGAGSPFWEPAVATYDCRFVASARYQTGSTLKINHRRYTCENCNFNTNFTYSLTCLGSTVQINVTASQNNTNSQYNLYQVSSPSTSDPLGPVIDQFSGNSGSFTVPNVVGTHYVIKHGNWSSDCSWRETRKLITIPQFNVSLSSCFNYNVFGSSSASTFTLSLSPCFNSGTTTHLWYLYRSSSSNGPFSFVGSNNSSNNAGVLFSSLTKGYYYRVYHYVTGPCSWYYSSQQTFYVNFFGAVEESSPITYKQGEEPEAHENLVQQAQSNLELSLWPNPARDQVNLSWTGADTDHDAIIEIFNSQGQQVRRIAAQAGQAQLEINTSGLSTGLYFLSVKQGDQVLEKKKFTIQR